MEVIERRPFCRDEYGPQKGRLYIQQGDSSWVLLGTGVLGDSLGALGHRMLCQFTRQQEPHSCLDLPTRDGRALVVVSQPRRLCCDALEDVVHEAVHDRHGLAGHSGVGMDLFEHLVDVDAEALLPLAPLLLLVGGTHIFLCLARLLHCFSARLGGHPRATCLREKIDVVTRKKMAKQQLGQPEIFSFLCSFYRFSQHSEKCAPIGQHSRARETVRCDWSTPKIKLRDWLLREPMSKQLKLQFFGRGFWERSAMKQRQCKAKTRSCSAPQAERTGTCFDFLLLDALTPSLTQCSLVCSVVHFSPPPRCLGAEKEARQRARARPVPAARGSSFPWEGSTDYCERATTRSE